MPTGAPVASGELVAGALRPANHLQLEVDQRSKYLVSEMQTAQLIDQLDGLAGRRRSNGSRIPRDSDLLLGLAEHVPTAVPEDAARLLHAVLSAVKRKAISEAFAGRLLDRLLPKPAPAHHRPTITVSLPKITDAASFAEAQAALLRATAGGELTPAEAKTMGSVLAMTWQSVRAAERQRRMAGWPR